MIRKLQQNNIASLKKVRNFTGLTVVLLITSAMQGEMETKNPKGRRDLVIMAVV
jgi:hypothetical protein